MGDNKEIHSSLEPLTSNNYPALACKSRVISVGDQKDMIISRTYINEKMLNKLGYTTEDMLYNLMKKGLIKLFQDKGNVQTLGEVLKKVADSLANFSGSFTFPQNISLIYKDGKVVETEGFYSLSLVKNDCYTVFWIPSNQGV
eukprot:TRINITY_DN6826_c0_g1_i1.p1 TRINITY_DN6826_c0_g1~~TRINITY_DN6826_c0_g1_i1.p1  ORF type:complete len:143 (+),score=15.34 TRINITY_DN6826_c0_g1_i1:92-520(+)